MIIQIIVTGYEILKYVAIALALIFCVAFTIGCFFCHNEHFGTVVYPKEWEKERMAQTERRKSNRN